MTGGASICVAALLSLTLAGAGEGAAAQVETARGAVLRGLDKLDGSVRDITLDSGQEARFGGLLVRLRECRYPSGNPAGDAFAYLEITDLRKGDTPVFRGWMIASAPALNALDHARHDVWVLRCNTD